MWDKMNRIQMLFRTAALLVFSLTLSACSTTPVDLSYAPSATPSKAAKPAVEAVVATDQRKQDAKWLGAIRGGMGNPLKTLETSVPVSEVVAAAFSDGLKSRGLLGSGSPYLLELVVNQFDCNQLVRREAHAKITVSLVDKLSKQAVYQQMVQADKVTGSVLTMDAGILAKVDDLRIVANDVLQDAVDLAFNDPRFLAVVGK